MKQVLMLALISSLLTLSGCMLMHGDHMGHHQGIDKAQVNDETSRPGSGHSH